MIGAAPSPNEKALRLSPPRSLPPPLLLPLLRLPRLEAGRLDERLVVRVAMVSSLIWVAGQTVGTKRAFPPLDERRLDRVRRFWWGRRRAVFGRRRHWLGPGSCIGLGRQRPARGRQLGNDILQRRQRLCRLI